MPSSSDDMPVLEPIEPESDRQVLMRLVADHEQEQQRLLELERLPERDGGDEKYQVKKHFSKTPGLTPMGSSRHRAANEALRAVLREHDLAFLPHSGLNWAGSWNWTRYHEREKIALFVVELMPANQVRWLDIDKEVREIAFNIRGLEEVFVRYYIYWADDTDTDDGLRPPMRLNVVPPRPARSPTNVQQQQQRQQEREQRRQQRQRRQEWQQQHDAMVSSLADLEQQIAEIEDNAPVPNDSQQLPEAEDDARVRRDILQLLEDDRVGQRQRLEAIGGLTYLNEHILEIEHIARVRSHFPQLSAIADDARVRRAYSQLLEDDREQERQRHVTRSTSARLGNHYQRILENDEAHFERHFEQLLEDAEDPLTEDHQPDRVHRYRTAERRRWRSGFPAHVPVQAPQTPERAISPGLRGYGSQAPIVSPSAGRPMQGPTESSLPWPLGEGTRPREGRRPPSPAPYTNQFGIYVFDELDPRFPYGPIPRNSSPRARWYAENIRSLLPRSSPPPPPYRSTLFSPPSQVLQDLWELWESSS